MFLWLIGCVTTALVGEVGVELEAATELEQEQEGCEPSLVASMERDGDWLTVEGTWKAEGYGDGWLRIEGSVRSPDPAEHPEPLRGSWGAQGETEHPVQAWVHPFNDSETVWLEGLAESEELPHAWLEVEVVEDGVDVEGWWSFAGAAVVLDVGSQGALTGDWTVDGTSYAVAGTWREEAHGGVQLSGVVALDDGDADFSGRWSEDRGAWQITLEGWGVARGGAIAGEQAQLQGEGFAYGCATL